MHDEDVSISSLDRIGRGAKRLAKSLTGCTLVCEQRDKGGTDAGRNICVRKYRVQSLSIPMPKIELPDVRVVLGANSNKNSGNSHQGSPETSDRTLHDRTLQVL